MAWSSLTSNQWVSGANLTDAISNEIVWLRDGCSIPNTSRILTKDQVHNNCWINTITGNRFAIKSNIVPSAFYLVTTSYAISTSGSSAACAATLASGAALYTNDATGKFLVGNYIYQRNVGTNQIKVLTSGTAYTVSYMDGSVRKYANISTGAQITAIGNCQTFYARGYSYKGTSSSIACSLAAAESGGALGNTYSTVNTSYFSVGDTVYVGDGTTNYPYIPSGGENYITTMISGINHWLLVDSSGVITDMGSCITYYLAGYAYESADAVTACTLVGGEGGFEIFTVRSGGYFDTGDKIYVYYSGAYHQISSDFPYLAYYSEFHSANIWLDHGGIGVLVTAGYC
ncbi:MAG: hypothetical protein V4663_05940 [Bacteroidota bacterium]